MKTKFSTCAFVACLAALLVADCAWAEDETPVPATLEELQQLVTEIVEENDVPAVGIALVEKTGPIWIDAIGKADIESDTDADADSMFRIGSTSKMFVSLSVLKLVEEGRLSLNDRVSDLAPDVEFENPWEDTDPVRVVHLLEHTTGWDDIHLPEYAHNVYPPVSLKEALDFHPHSRTSRWKPGTRMSYCNAGPAVAAYIVQTITGADFEDYVKDNFFAPMGMETMTYRLSEDFKARGVTLYANNQTPQPYWHINTRPTGSINASPRDMASFMQFFVNRGRVGGQQLLSEASLARMERVETTNAARAGQVAGYGLSNYSSSHNSWVYRAHNGGVLGGLTDFAYLPKAGRGYAVMVNSDDFGSLFDIVDLVRNFQTRDLQPPPAPAVQELTDEHRQIEGVYHPINSRQQVGHFLDRALGAYRLGFVDDKLEVGPVLGDEVDVYLPVSASLYAAEETGIAALAVANDPLAGTVVHAGNLVLKPAPAILVYGQLAIAALWALVIVTSFLYFLVWGARRLRKKIPPGPAIGIRLWPLLASASVVSVVVLFSAAMGDPFVRLGAPTFYSITIMLLTILFAFFAALGLTVAVEARKVPMNRWNYWYSTVSSCTHVVVATYLLWFGVIGLMTWA